MNPNEITAAVSIAARSDVIFDALVTPQAIRSWWHASSAIVYPFKNGIWVAMWGDENQPDYVSSARISEIRSPEELSLTDYTYWARETNEFLSGFTVRFLVVSTGVETSKLSVFQAGFESINASEEFVEACRTGWKETLAQLKSFCESGD